ncbi:divergent polysaccharide deacetylase family protein [Oceanibacterium hippocampi]|uniref:Divergent polysaccharide deacetylase n=1 Tax=Oceanibacterium hippocampi TaxID=745714 RepID=A0A1Y5T2C3_9PROT|nr:divergent polysaccharide deacetylase family protein [Oceanibacterium hippocampi]SLN54327.1 Divergent polysaccharide deacetylase [Oceanibacterium hippocampi]
MTARRRGRARPRTPLAATPLTLLLAAGLTLAFGLALGFLAGKFLGEPPEQHLAGAEAAPNPADEGVIAARAPSPPEPRLEQTDPIPAAAAGSADADLRQAASAELERLTHLPTPPAAATLPSEAVAPVAPDLPDPPEGGEALAPADMVPPWRRYAALVPAGGIGPRIAIVIDDLGLNSAQSAAFSKLDGPLTLSYLPYAHDLADQVAVARGAGHEIMLHLPMEPSVDADPGPNALLTGLSAEELQRRIVWNLDRFEGFVGVNNHMGSRFTADAEAMTPVIQALKQRGLLFLDSRTSADSRGYALARRLGVPAASRDLFLDNDDDVVRITAQLDLLRRMAEQHGTAIGIGHPHANTLTALAAWLPKAIAEGIRIVPVSALVVATVDG